MPSSSQPIEGFDLDAPWALAPQVAIRPESFGALAYHFGTRRLSFLKSLALRDVVVSARAALDGPRGLRGGRHRGARASGLRTLSGRAGEDPDDRAAGRGMSALRASSSLVERFERGLDAPICLTWELTYACNLACVHCLSSSGRRDPRELSTQECKAVIDEMQRMQVSLRQRRRRRADGPRGLLGAAGVRDRPRRGREVLDERQPDHGGARRLARGVELRRRADLAGRRDGGGQRPDPRSRLLRHGHPGDGAPRRGRGHRLQDLGRHDARERHAGRRLQGDRRPLRGAAAPDQAAAVRARGGRLGRPAPHPGPAARGLYDWLVEHGTPC